MIRRSNRWGISNKVVVDWKQYSATASFWPVIAIVDEKGKVIKDASKKEAKYFLSIDSVISVNEGN